MSKDKATFRVVVESPHGKQPIEQFRNWLGKVSDEARQRWGINIQVERLEGEQLPENGGFSDE